MDTTPAPTTDDTESGAPFLTAFDTPEPTPATTDEPVAVLDTPFDPQALVAEFKATAAAERKEQERIEQELKGKLLELNQLQRQQQEHHASLAAISLDETAARQLPHKLSTIDELGRALATQLETITEHGQLLETQRATITDTIKQLDRFIKETTGQRDEMIAQFGGGQLGEQRYTEVEQRTRQALERHGNELDRVKQQYDQWQQSTVAAIQPLADEVSLSVRQDTLTVRSLTALATDIETRCQSLRTLGEQAQTIISKLDVIDHAIDQLLADSRISERLQAEERAIADAFTAFCDSVVHAHKIPDREPTAVLVGKLARAFFEYALNQQQADEERRNTAAATATGLSKSLVGTLQKMRQQPAIDFVRLTAHLKAQLTLQDSAKPSFNAATKRYNDLLVFSLLTGLTGNPRQAFEPFRIEYSALGGAAGKEQSYLTERLTPLQPLCSILLAAVQAHQDTRAVKQQPAWPSWVTEAVQLIEQTKVPALIDRSAPTFTPLLAELTTLLSSHATTQQAHAEQEANRIRLRLEELDQTQRDLTERYEQSQEQLKQHLTALALVDDALELVNELERLVGQQQRFGLLPLARGNMKQHEEVEQRSKLLLLKLPDLRRAAELVSLDLGQVDVTDPGKLKPQFITFKARIAQTVEQARTQQTSALDSLRSLVELFDQVILGDKDFDLVIRSQWLPKELSEQLFAQYRTVEQRYRQTIQTHNLRRTDQGST